MQFSAAQHAEGVGRLAGLDAQRNVAQQFAFEPVLYMPGGEEFPALCRQMGLCIDAECHFHRRLRDVDEGQRLDVQRIAQCVADVDVVNTAG